MTERRQSKVAKKINKVNKRNEGNDFETINFMS